MRGTTSMQIRALTADRETSHMTSRHSSGCTIESFLSENIISIPRVASLPVSVRVLSKEICVLDINR